MTSGVTWSVDLPFNVEIAGIEGPQQSLIAIDSVENCCIKMDVTRLLRQIRRAGSIEKEEVQEERVYCYEEMEYSSVFTTEEFSSSTDATYSACIIDFKISSGLIMMRDEEAGTDWEFSKISRFSDFDKKRLELELWSLKRIGGPFVRISSCRYTITLIGAAKNPFPVKMLRGTTEALNAFNGLGTVEGSTEALNKFNDLGTYTGTTEAVKEFNGIGIVVGSTKALKEFNGLGAEAGTTEAVKEFNGLGADAGNPKASKKFSGLGTDAENPGAVKEFNGLGADTGTTEAVKEFSGLGTDTGTTEAMKEFSGLGTGNPEAVKEFNGLGADAGNSEAVKEFNGLGTDAGNPEVVKEFNGLGTGNPEAVKEFNALGTDAGNSEAVKELSGLGTDAGNSEAVKEFNGLGADAGNSEAVKEFNGFGTDAGNPEAMKEFSCLGTDAGTTEAVKKFNSLGTDAGTTEAVKKYDSLGTDEGNPEAVKEFNGLGTDAGNPETVKEFNGLGTDAGTTEAVKELNGLCTDAGTTEAVKEFSGLGTDAGNPEAMKEFSGLGSDTGNPEVMKEFNGLGTDTGTTEAVKDQSPETAKEMKQLRTPEHRKSLKRGGLFQWISLTSLLRKKDIPIWLLVMICLSLLVSQAEGCLSGAQVVEDIKKLDASAICNMQEIPVSCKEGLLPVCLHNAHDNALAWVCAPDICVNGKVCAEWNKMLNGSYVVQGGSGNCTCPPFYTLSEWKAYPECYKPVAPAIDNTQTLSPGAIAGIVIGVSVVIVVPLIIAVYWFCIRRKKCPTCFSLCKSSSGGENTCTHKRKEEDRKKNIEQNIPLRKNDEPNGNSH